MATRSILVAMLAIATAFTSCTKDGATGPAGAAGADGKNGTNGTNGVANISSHIYTVASSAWAPDGSGLYTTIISDTAVSNVTSDGVQVFCEIAAGNFMALPAPNVLNWGDEVYWESRAGLVEVLYAFTSAPSATTSFKIVVIPPGVMKQHPNTNWSNYSEVQAIIATQKNSF
ncbi:MAG TPA: hypothetical protein VK783_10305 [Bacteroidia bacterium]|nr:hypothetical protein [Bacteroidia bacterium]